MYKILKVKKDIHKEIKILAAKADLNIQDYIETVFLKVIEQDKVKAKSNN